MPLIISCPYLFSLLLLPFDFYFSCFILCLERYSFFCYYSRNIFPPKRHPVLIEEMPYRLLFVLESLLINCFLNFSFSCVVFPSSKLTVSLLFWSLYFMSEVLLKFLKFLVTPPPSSETLFCSLQGIT